MKSACVLLYLYTGEIILILQEADNESGTADDHYDIIMYCTPATEEEILHSQIMSYGVKDLPSTDIV